MTTEEIKILLEAVGGKAVEKEVGGVEASVEGLLEVFGDIGETASIEEKQAALRELSNYLDSAVKDAENFAGSNAEQEAGIAALRKEIEAEHSALEELAKSQAKAAEEAAIAAEIRKDAIAASREQSENIRKAEEALRDQAEAAEWAAFETQALAEAASAQAAADKESNFAAAQKEKALRKLETAVGNLIPGFSTMRQKVSDLSDAWKASGTAGVGFGSRLLALAGGPVGILTGAVAGLTTVFVNYRKEIEATREKVNELLKSSDDYLDSVGNQPGALVEAMNSASGLADELDRILTNQNAVNDAFEIAEERVAALKKAQDDAAKREIDQQVEDGSLSKEEGRAQKAELEAAALQREVDQKQKIADAEVKTATEALRLAKEAEKIAKAEAEAAARDAEQVAKDANLPMFKAQNKSIAGDLITDITNADPDAGAKALNLAGGEEAVRDFIDEMEGITGGLARFNMDAGASLEDILMQPGVRSKIAKQLAAQSEEELERAKESADAAKAVADEKASEKQKELEAIRSIREAAEKEAAAARANSEQADFEKDLAEDYSIPEKKAEAERARKAEQNRVDKAIEEEDAERREKSDSRYDENKADVDRQGKEMSDFIDNLLAGGSDSPKTAAFRAKLKEISAMLDDGTDSGELQLIKELLDTLELSAGIANSAKKEVAALSQRVSTLAGQLKNFRP